MASHRKHESSKSIQTSLEAISSSVNISLNNSTPEQEIYLILDFPDVPFTLDATNLTADVVLTQIAQWRERVHALVVTLTADSISRDNIECRSLTLMRQQFLLSLAHQADVTFSTKKLDSGIAKDIGGAMRITGKTMDRILQEKEVLYFVDVGVGKGVEVWERGELRI
jgi:hypothetical protein